MPYSGDSLFYKSILTKAERANETFYFENSELIIKNLTFYYATKMSYNQSGGVEHNLCHADNRRTRMGIEGSLPSRDKAH